MNTATISGEQLYNLFVGGYNNLQTHEKIIDSLNVFPVPDGDTGSNMVMTLLGGVSAVNDKSSAEDVMRIFSKGTLFSARGNSGVILSQFIRGFANGVSGKESLSTTDFACAMEQGVQCAYKAVLTPVEGTVLTVMRETAEYLNQNLDETSDFTEFFDRLIAKMKSSLEKTPEKLAVLKEAGVVDSGGAGLLCIFEGMQAVAQGKSVDSIPAPSQKTFSAAGRLEKDAQLEYGYCTEFILQLMDRKIPTSDFKLEELIAFLEGVGDSVVAVMDEDIVKIHVHTFKPEDALAFAHKYGEFLSLKIENMSLQHSETTLNENNTNAKPSQKAEHKQFAVVVTAPGEGIGEYFMNIGADVVVKGGQTNNPSAEDFIDAFKTLNADHIIVLPNNGNVVMAANQAAEIYTETDVRVIKTRSIAEGYSALSMIDPCAETVEQFVGAMTSCLGGVTTGYVTTSTRDVTMNGIEIKKGKYIGLDGNNILCCEDNKINAVINLLKSLPDISMKETAIIFCGEDVTEGEKQQVEELISKEYPLFDIGFIDGKQPVYSFILSVE